MQLVIFSFLSGCCLASNLSPVAPSHGRHTGFAGRIVGEQFPLRSSRFSDDFYVNLLANLSEVANLVRLTAFLNK